MLPLVLAAITQVGSPAWLVIGWVALAIAFASAGVIAWDIVVRGNRSEMAVMNLVWPITALYWGPVAAWFYFTRERERGDWWSTAKGVSHCGAGCTLGDIVGEWVVYLTAFSIPIFASESANTLMAMFAADFVLAWSFGVAFQYFSIVPMREDVGRLQGIWLAIKADTLSIVAFQVGLFGYMALYHLVLWQPPLTVASPTYWLMMQIGMVVGFFTAWPVNAWLIRRGIKEAM
ncbi:MAG: DUF4396 domain-containing protein [Solirubrobacterales bacterium]